MQGGRVLSTVRIGISKKSNKNLSNCRVYIEKVAPEPALLGGLPIPLADSNFTLRHDDPERFVDIASHWNHVDKFRFSSPINGFFAASLCYLKDDVEFIIVIRFTSNEIQKSARLRTLYGVNLT